ncbi:MAG: aspartyl-phosphate phosphatase Spo0E family protein [Clostridium sp.]
MEAARKAMHEAIDIYGLGSKEALKASEELDKYIVEAQKIKAGINDEPEALKFEYDCVGRMKYNPEIHFNQSRPWSYEDEEYIINWLDRIGIEEMSFALGRTEATISQKASRLRKEGRMKPKDKHAVRNIRILKKEAKGISI